MSRFELLFALLLTWIVQPMTATTYYVGPCKNGSYNTIGEAIAAVPAGSTIDVCPGTYAEQLTISKSLTLQGVASSNSSQVILAVPSGGLALTNSILYGPTVAQIEVDAGPVNITDITVDGSGLSSNCPTVNESLGIFYASGSSGTLKGIDTRNQTCVYGIGIHAENGAGATDSLIIENSNIHDNSLEGIHAYTNQTPPTLALTIRNNSVTGNATSIDLFGVAASVSANNLGGNFGGVSMEGSSSGAVLDNTVTTPEVGIGVTVPVTVSGNIVIGAAWGLTVGVGAAGASITSNHIFNNQQYGIYVQTDGATIKNNIISNASIGIELNCHADTAAGNSLNGPSTGIDKVPAAFAGVNSFYNVATARTGGC